MAIGRIGDCSCGCGDVPSCCEPNFGPTATLVHTYTLDPTTATYVGVPGGTIGYVKETNVSVTGGSYIWAFVSGAWNPGGGWAGTRIPVLGNHGAWPGQIAYAPYYTSQDHYLYIDGNGPDTGYASSYWMSFDEPQPSGSGFSTAAEAQTWMTCRIVRFLHDSSDMTIYFTDDELAANPLNTPPTAANSISGSLGAPVFKLYHIAPDLTVRCNTHAFVDWYVDNSTGRVKCEARFYIKNNTCGIHNLTLELLATGGVVTVTSAASQTALFQPFEEKLFIWSWTVVDGNTGVTSTIQVTNGGYETIPSIVTNHTPVLSISSASLGGDTFGDYRGYDVIVEPVAHGSTARLAFHITLESTIAQIVNPDTLEILSAYDGSVTGSLGAGVITPFCPSNPDDPNALHDSGLIHFVIKKNGATSANVRLQLTDGAVSYADRVYTLSW